MLERLMLLLSLNDEYDKTIARINSILTALRKANPGFANEMLYAYCYDEYYEIASAPDRTIMTQRYNYYAIQNPSATEEQNKHNALLSYINIKNDEISQARVGIYFDDDSETSSNKYQLMLNGQILKKLLLY